MPAHILAPPEVADGFRRVIQPIAIGKQRDPFDEFALQTAEKIGPVNVDVGNTSCQIPFAPDYIKKSEKRGTIDKKRKTFKC